MGFYSYVFRFIFKNKLSDYQIINKLCSFNASWIPDADNEIFREKMSIILEFKNAMGINKRFFQIGNQKLTILNGSFLEDSFLEEFLYFHLQKKMENDNYSNEDCNLSFHSFKYGYANIFVSFLFSRDQLELFRIIFNISHKLTENNYSLFQNNFLSLKEKFISLHNKLHNINLSEKDLKTVLNYINLTKLLQRDHYLRNVFNLKDYYSSFDSFYTILIPTLIENDIISSPYEIYQFFDFNLQTQLTLSKGWIRKFQSRISGEYSWEELITVFTIINFTSNSKIGFFNGEDLEKKISEKFGNLTDSEIRTQKESLYKEIMEKRRQEKAVFTYVFSTNNKYYNIDDFISADNLNSVNENIEYLSNIIEEFLIESKKLIPGCFQTLVGDLLLTNSSIEMEEEKEEEIFEFARINLQEEISQKYWTETITKPSSLTYSTIYSNDAFNEAATKVIRFLRLLPSQVLDGLEDDFTILQSKEEGNFQYISPIHLVNCEAHKNIDRLKEIEKFLHDIYLENEFYRSN